jgi:hypothetical protein
LAEARSGGIYLHNRATGTGVAIEIGPTLDGWDEAELQSGTVGSGYADSHPYLATDAVFGGNVSLSGSRAAIKLPDGGALAFCRHSGASDIPVITKDGADNIRLGNSEGSDIFFQGSKGIAMTIKGVTSQIGVGTTDPTVSGTGTFHAAGDTARPFDKMRTPTDIIPGSGDSCNTGEIFYDTRYLYICVVGSTNNTSTIKRAVLE